MNFKDWCKHEFGVIGFSEGKISNRVFLPAFPFAQIRSNELIEEHGGYIINVSYLRGYVIPIDKYKILVYKLLSCSSIFLINPNAYESILHDFFRDVGVNLAARSEYKEPAPMHLIFNTEKNLHRFANIFFQLQPVLKINTLAESYTVQLSAFVIAYLQQLYYQQTNTTLLNTASIKKIKIQISELCKLKEIIIRRQLMSSIDDASILSRDYSNIIKNGVALLPWEAASAYAVSLHCFAELNRDNLSLGDYLNLRIASSLFDSYNQNGSLKQSLKTDVYFVFKLITDHVHPYRWGVKHETPFFSQLPEAIQKKIRAVIAQNNTELLHGTPNSRLRGKIFFKMKRFLPDESMNSETNELILQGGGMCMHSAIVRIIKVGMLANGERAHWQQKPLYYEYYKVVDNLGVGSNGTNFQNKTCLGGGVI